VLSPEQVPLLGRCHGNGSANKPEALQKAIALSKPTISKY